MKPKYLFDSLWRYRVLVKHMVLRDIQSRYKGSVLGVLWSLISPVVMLTIYTFFFSVVFRSKWNSGIEGKFEFAIVLFAGLIIFNFFAECITKAPSLIVGNVNYVKKVIFPLEVLSWVSIGSAAFNLMIGYIVLISFLVLSGMPVHWTVLIFPIVILPLVPIVAGLSWVLAGLGVFFRDINQMIGMFITAMMFLCPIFYPISALPEYLMDYIYLNPLTFIVEQSRAVLIFGTMPDWIGLLTYLLVSFLIAWLGLFAFNSMRKGFADVL
jgi:lipopolysaccharide transport system permease protein